MEIIDLLAEKNKLSPASIEKYNQQYNFLTRNFGVENKNWIQTADETHLKNIINKLEIGPAGKSNYLNLIILIRDQSGAGTEILKKLKISLRGKVEIKTIENTINRINEPLASFETIENFINDLYKNGDWIRFIYNFLIFKFALRNKDVNLTLIQKKEWSKLAPNDKQNKNWLIFNKSTYTLFIDDYKTKNAYGTKTITDTNKKLIDAVNRLGEGALLQKSNGSELKETELSYYIKLYQDQTTHLTESDYFRINVVYLQNQPNSIARLAELSKTRGTQNLQTINSHYNLAQPKK